MEDRGEVNDMRDAIESATVFGSLLRENAAAAAYYDSCTWEQKKAILQQLASVEDMAAYVRDMAKAL